MAAGEDGILNLEAHVAEQGQAFDRSGWQGAFSGSMENTGSGGIESGERQRLADDAISDSSLKKASAYEEDYPKAVIKSYEDMAEVYAAKKLILEESEKHLTGWGAGSACDFDARVVEMLLLSKTDRIPPGKVLEILNKAFQSDPPYLQKELDAQKVEVLQINDQLFSGGMASWMPEHKTIGDQTARELIESRNKGLPQPGSPESEYNVLLEKQYGEENIRKAMVFERADPARAIQLYPEMINIYANKNAILMRLDAEDQDQELKRNTIAKFDQWALKVLLEGKGQSAGQEYLALVEERIKGDGAIELKPALPSLSWQKPGPEDIALRNQAMAEEFRQEGSASNLTRFPELALYRLQVRKIEDTIKSLPKEEQAAVIKDSMEIITRNIEQGKMPRFEYDQKEIQGVEKEMRSYEK